MGVGSAGRIALSGATSAALAIDVLANNLANSQTPGFKQSQARFSTQTPQTWGAGSAPSSLDAGRNPRQTGGGVQVTAIDVDFSPGSLQLSGNPQDLALEGNGLFVLEGEGGERFYSRDGSFTLNARRELVTAGGERLLGYAADENFQIDRSQLRPITIPSARAADDEEGQAVHLTSFSVAEDGRVQGKYTDGMTRELGEIQLAHFTNPSGLVHRGGNLYSSGPNSGLPTEGSPGEGGAATIVSGATEASNTDIGENLIQLSLLSTQFRASLQTISAGKNMLDELSFLLR